MNGDGAEPGPVIGPRPELPPGPPVPDDRIYGDSLEQAEGNRRHGTYRPPAPTPPPRPPRRRSGGPLNRRRRWVPMVVVLGFLIVGMNQGPRSGTAEAHSTVRHPVSAVRVQTSSGEVTVSAGADDDTVELTREVSRDDGAGVSGGAETWEGNTLVLIPTGGCSSPSADCSGDYTLQVPEGTRVTIETGSGDVQLEGRLGAVDVRTGSGDLEMDDLASTAVKARTGSGDVDVSMAGAPDALTLTTGSGEVKVRLPGQDSYAVDETTGSGKREVTVRKDVDSAHRVRVETGSGDIEIKPR